ncbi:hypothetical protein KP509_07G099400 [Ceratopteris richardii]|uniref:Uncharacterized protein n=1 Tax=Ceratopteris richardii TaxID=49495 RepID=A0A8T2UJN6_CERRI|nr:hypothetical protein KP509_07G099400 [Ceratopteris richardii]
MSIAETSELEFSEADRRLGIGETQTTMDSVCMTGCVLFSLLSLCFFPFFAGCESKNLCFLASFDCIHMEFLFLTGRLLPDLPQRGRTKSRRLPTLDLNSPR